MSGDTQATPAAGAIPRRLFFYNGGFVVQKRLRRILQLAGHPLCIGLPGPDDGVVVWGRSPYAGRGEQIAARRRVPLIRLEDAFLRSVRPGRMGDAPLGLMIDPFGVHFDSAVPSRLERILATDPLDHTELLSRARTAAARMRTLDLSKYNSHDPGLALPAPGYVLVVDQTKGDASIRHAGATARSFAELLALAQEEHPTARIVIKTHPETQSGLRKGHFGPGDVQGRVSLVSTPVSPLKLLEGAIAVYTVSSQLGFEAIMLGHRPVVLGQPFYAGWGLSDDRTPLPRRHRRLTATQLFAAAMIVAPIWYDPCRDRLCPLEDAMDQIEAEATAYRQDHNGHVACGMRLWKRRRLQDFFGATKPLIFENDPTRAAALASRTGRSLLIWAGKTPETLACPAFRVEDGFLRSRGLGAELVAPISLVTDDLGIYYDPTRPSRIEALMVRPLPPGGEARARALVQRLVAARLSKYNLGGSLPDLPQGLRILVPGQVEDDASIRLGAGPVRTNLGQLQAARTANPAAVLIYKPHPDVETGLRPGVIAADALHKLADVVATSADPVALIDGCDALWTMTSLMGFEALLRGKPVTCLGAPFYAGWGLTTDLGPVPDRRVQALSTAPQRPTLLHLVHAALIAYPRYYDPVSRLPCPVEVAVDRLSSGTLPPGGRALRLLAKAQGLLASQAHLWR